MSGKVKEVAVEEAERIKTLTSDAVRSGAYLYPLRVSSSFFYTSLRKNEKKSPQDPLAFGILNGLDEARNGRFELTLRLHNGLKTHRE